MNQTTEPPVNRLYKSRIFAMLYQDKKELLDLYNAMSGKHYEDPELLKINTLENAITVFPHDKGLKPVWNKAGKDSNTPVCYLLQRRAGNAGSEAITAVRCIQRERRASGVGAACSHAEYQSGHNEELKRLCKSLNDYSEYTARVQIGSSKGTGSKEINKRNVGF